MPTQCIIKKHKTPLCGTFLSYILCIFPLSHSWDVRRTKHWKPKHKWTKEKMKCNKTANEQRQAPNLQLTWAHWITSWNAKDFRWFFHMLILALKFKVKQPFSTATYYSEGLPAPRLIAPLCFVTKKTIYIWLYPTTFTDISSTSWPTFNSIIFFLFAFSEGKPEEIIYFRVFFSHGCLKKFRPKISRTLCHHSFKNTHSVFMWVKSMTPHYKWQPQFWYCNTGV